MKELICFFVWVGGEPLNPMHEECMESWLKYGPRNAKYILFSETFPKIKRLIRLARGVKTP